MIGITSQFKIQYLECDIVFINDHRKKSYKQCHDRKSKNNKHIKWEQADAVQNTFETCKKKKAKVSNEDLTLSQSVQENVS